MVVYVHKRGSNYHYVNAETDIPGKDYHFYFFWRCIRFIKLILTFFVCFILIDEFLFMRMEKGNSVKKKIAVW